MFNSAQSEVVEMRKNRTKVAVFWTLIHLAICYALITYVPYGMFFVLAYILYSLESQGMLQLLNTQEANLQLNLLNQNGPSEVDALRHALEELKEKLADLELRS